MYRRGKNDATFLNTVLDQYHNLEFRGVQRRLPKTGIIRTECALFDYLEEKLSYGSDECEVIGHHCECAHRSIVGIVWPEEVVVRASP